MGRSIIRALLRPIYLVLIKRLLRPFAWKFRRYFVSGFEVTDKQTQLLGNDRFLLASLKTHDYQFQEINRKLEEAQQKFREIIGMLEKTLEMSIPPKQRLRALAEFGLDHLQEGIEPTGENLNKGWENLAQPVDESIRQILNREFSWKGMLAKGGYWINQGPSFSFESGFLVKLETMNERISEIPFALRQISPKARTVLDLGSAESLLPLQIASSTRAQVTAVDLRNYPFFHSRVTYQKADLRELPFDENTFQFVVSLSTIEHIGLGHYGDPKDADGDKKALKEAHRVLNSKGKFIGTFPLGSGLVTEIQRLYRPEYILQLLENLFSPSEVKFSKFESSLKQWIYIESLPELDMNPGNAEVQCVLLFSGVKK